MIYFFRDIHLLRSKVWYCKNLQDLVRSEPEIWPRDRSPEILYRKINLTKSCYHIIKSFKFLQHHTLRSYKMNVSKELNSEISKSFLNLIWNNMRFHIRVLQQNRNPFRPWIDGSFAILRRSQLKVRFLKFLCWYSVNNSFRDWFRVRSWIDFGLIQINWAVR